MHKSRGAPWVRIASSVQSRLDGPWLPNAPPAETARWKRCVPSLDANQRITATDHSGDKVMNHITGTARYRSDLMAGLAQAEALAGLIIERAESDGSQ